MPGHDVAVVVAKLVGYLVNKRGLAHVDTSPPVGRGVTDVIRQLVAVEGIGGLDASPFLMGSGRAVHGATSDAPAAMPAMPPAST